MILNGLQKNIFEEKNLADEPPHPQWQKSVFFHLFGVISKVRPESKWESDVPWLGPSRGVVPCMPTVPEVSLSLGRYLIYSRKGRTLTHRCAYLTGLSWLSWSYWLSWKSKTKVTERLIYNLKSRNGSTSKKEDVSNDKDLFLCQGLAPASRRSLTSSGWP